MQVMLNEAVYYGQWVWWRDTIDAVCVLWPIDLGRGFPFGIADVGIEICTTIRYINKHKVGEIFGAEVRWQPWMDKSQNYGMLRVDIKDKRLIEHTQGLLNV